MWLQTFAKIVEDNLPEESVTVLLYRCLNALHKENIDNMALLEFEPAKQHHFDVVFNEVSKNLKIRLCKATGCFVTCLVCDAYHSHL